ncbi:hypothetical protein [Myxococcus xanthus]|uniref:hypothetical protein n=1 Tax=Myxococcus xanthus TaxID=34 RepID=UPI001F4047A5|nr:hypothetical protein [Myxococcus xanthus]
MMAPTGRMLERTGVTAKVGAEHLYAQVLDAVVEQLGRRLGRAESALGEERPGPH